MPPRGDFPSSKLDQYMLRFPDGMREQLKAAAATNNRSLNAEIVARLERSFEIDEAVEDPAKAVEAALPLIRTAVDERLAGVEDLLRQVLELGGISPEDRVTLAENGKAVDRLRRRRSSK